VYNIFDPHHYVPTLPQAAAMAIHAGCDQNCGDTMPKYLGKAVEEELVSEDDISRAVVRLFTVRMLFGEFDPPENVPYSTISFDAVDSPAHRQLALEGARQSIVLLKNDGNILPLQKSQLQTVAVIGPMAGACHLGGYSGSPFVRISPYEGIANALGAAVERQHVWPDELERVSKGVQTQDSSEAHKNIGWIGDGSWVEYKPQDLTDKTHIAIRVASPVSGSRIAVHLDGLNGPRIATLSVPNTGNWQHWKTISAAVRPAMGAHKIFFKFRGNGKTICNVEWFQLQPDTLPYNEQALWYWHEDQRKFVLQDGRLKLMIGSSSADIHLIGEITLAASTGKIGGPDSLTFQAGNPAKST
jgi:beta-glucosidase